ncbi:MAG: MFS transporter, partial [Desulfuromonas sp.]
MQRKLNSKAIWGWSLYDFASSAYTTLIVTFIYATYFTQKVAPDSTTGTALWANAITISALAVAILAPPLGRLADQRGHIKIFLFVATLLCCGGSALLFPLTSDHVTAALFLVILSNIAFELGYVFYNSLLTSVAPPERLGTVSGIGWGVGYFGGLAALGLALIGFVSTEQPWFGLTTDNGANIRACTLIVALWYLIFSLPLFVWVPRNAKHPEADSKRSGLLHALRSIRHYPQAFRLLLARLFYNDGLVTLFAFGGIYAAGTFAFSFSEILIFGIILNLAAGLGALLFGLVEDTIGGKKVLLCSIVALTIATLTASIAPDRSYLWGAGIAIGLFAGPAQASSRSLFARFIPQKHENLFFGLFAFSGKLTAFAGPFLLGQVTLISGSQRFGVMTILLFFLVGLILLCTID